MAQKFPQLVNLCNSSRSLEDVYEIRKFRYLKSLTCWGMLAADSRSLKTLIDSIAFNQTLQVLDLKGVFLSSTEIEHFVDNVLDCGLRSSVNKPKRHNAIVKLRVSFYYSNITNQFLKRAYACGENTRPCQLQFLHLNCANVFDSAKVISNNFYIRHFFVDSCDFSPLIELVRNICRRNRKLLPENYTSVFVDTVLALWPLIGSNCYLYMWILDHNDFYEKIEDAAKIQLLRRICNSIIALLQNDVQ